MPRAATSVVTPLTKNAPPCSERSLNRDNRTDKEMLEEALKVAANADHADGVGTVTQISIGLTRKSRGF